MTYARCFVAPDQRTTRRREHPLHDRLLSLGLPVFLRRYRQRRGAIEGARRVASCIPFTSSVRWLSSGNLFLFTSWSFPGSSDRRQLHRIGADHARYIRRVEVVVGAICLCTAGEHYYVVLNKDGVRETMMELLPLEGRAMGIPLKVRGVSRHVLSASQPVSCSSMESIKHLRGGLMIIPFKVNDRLLGVLKQWGYWRTELV